MAKAGLIVVFNHNFERNIPKLEEYYRDRFSVRRYLVPFSKSDRPDVFRVVEDGRTFGGHIAQSRSFYAEPDVTHYIFLADDLILNPELNEENAISRIGLPDDSGYIKNLVSADLIRHSWHWAITATRNLLTAGFDYRSQLPEANEAQRKFEAMNLSFRSPWPRTPLDLRSMAIGFPRRIFIRWLSIVAAMGKPSVYPLLAGYSDFVVVPAKYVSTFADYCGVFAALNMFAEVGIPTALALACPSIKTELQIGSHFMEKPVKFSSSAIMFGAELWFAEIERFAKSMNYDWNALISNFKPDVLYYHPIKLSMWK